MKENLKSPLRVITDLGIPTDSIIHAVQHIQSQDETHHYNIFGPYSQQQYEEMITEIMGLDVTPSYDSWKIARVYFGYTVQETLCAFNTGDRPDIDELWKTINSRAEYFMKDQPWAVKEYVTENLDEEQKLDASGNPKQKKGAKKEAAKKIWNNNPDKQQSMTRKEWIALLCEEVGLSPAAASTYYANLKNGKV